MCSTHVACIMHNILWMVLGFVSRGSVLGLGIHCSAYRLQAEPEECRATLKAKVHPVTVPEADLVKAVQPDVVKVMKTLAAVSPCGRVEQGALCFAKHDGRYVVGVVLRLLVGYIVQGSDAHIVHLLLAIHHASADGCFVAAGQNVLVPGQALVLSAPYIPAGRGLRPVFWKHLLP